MVITYNGGTFFKVAFGSTTLAFNPVSKKSKLKQSRFGADIALVSLKHPDTNGIEMVTHGDKEPFVINDPGEYEVADVTVVGADSVSRYDKDATHNTIYLVTLEGMRLCFLGLLGEAKLPPEAIEMLEHVDILFLPLDEKTLGPSGAHELSVKLEPHIIVPMQYESNDLKKFLKEEGVEGLKATDKVTLKKKDLDGKEGEVVLLKSSA